MTRSYARVGYYDGHYADIGDSLYTNTLRYLPTIEGYCYQGDYGMTRSNLRLTRDAINGYGLLPPAITMLGKWPMIITSPTWKDAYAELTAMDIRNGFAPDFVRL